MDFKDAFEQYFNKESVLKYYLFDFFIGGIDGLSKNFHLCSWDGLVYYVLPYDLDKISVQVKLFLIDLEA